MKQIIIDTYFTKDKIIKVNDGDLEFVDIVSKDDKSLVGNIYVGRVDKIINKNFAFVEIGDEKKAFIDLSDTKENLNVDFENDKKLKIKQGDKLLVQVLRDKTSEKGAMLTSQINYKGKNIVIFRALSPTVSVSKKIDDNSREVLKQFGKELVTENFSVLFRTTSQEFVDKLDILTDEYNELVHTVKKMEQLAQMQKPPSLVQSNNYFIDTLNTIIDDEYSIITNDKLVFDSIQTYLEENNLNNNITIEDNLLINYDIQKQIDKLFHKKIWLKSGGFLFIEQTEATVVIDVNTGKNTKTKNRRKLIKQTNTEAIVEIARQVKLRNLSGIIIVDLIDCKTESDLIEIKKVAKKEFKNDNVTVASITSLGLLEITRKKTSESIINKNKVDCVVCNGDGKVFDYDYIINTIMCDVFKLGTRQRIIIRANEKVISFIEFKYTQLFEDLSKQLHTTIEFEQIQTGRIDYFEVDFE